MNPLFLAGGAILFSIGLLTGKKKENKVIPAGAKSVPITKSTDNEPKIETSSNLPNTGVIDNVDVVAGNQQEIGE